MLSITDEQFELGKRENHTVCMAENGKLYLASPGADANDQRLAMLADFIPKAGRSYILELPE